MPRFRPTTQGQLQEELERQAAALEEDVRQLRALLRVEEEQEVDDVRRHGEVAQDEVEGAVRGGVEGLAGVEGENVVGPSPLELPLRHEQWRACVGARDPCCQSLTTPCRVSTSVMRLVRRPVSSFMSSWPRAMGL